MKELYVVFDRHDPNCRIPFVGIFDTEEQAQALVDKLNVKGKVMTKLLAWYEKYTINTLHHRASVPK